MSGTDFANGAYSALAEFRRELIANRGLIENEDEPVFDVILDLLDRCLAEIEEGASD